MKFLHVYFLVFSYKIVFFSFLSSCIIVNLHCSVQKNFLAEMDPKEREEMTNEVVRRNRKKGVKKKEKAEHAPKDAPIMVEQTVVCHG